MTAGVPGPPPPGPPPTGTREPTANREPTAIRDLAALLRAAGLDPSAEELADALWLAGRTRAAARTAGSAAGTDGTDETDGAEGAREGAADDGRDGAGGDSGTGEPGPDPEPGPEAPPEEDPVGLYVPGRPGSYGAGQRIPEVDPEPTGGNAVPVRVPTAAALPRILDIQRALRALQRRRPPAPRARTVLDEPATAEASARALGLAIPVMRAETRRESTMRLVLDASPSMAVWHDMFDELRAVCERLGAFRDVQVHYLHRRADGAPALGTGSEPEPEARMRSAELLRDPTGRGLTMVVSDCAGPLWREGEAQRLLYRWAQCTPCVVVQPLPQRLWGRSWLPTERGTLARGEGGEGGEPHLEFRSDRPPRPGRPAGGLTVPVLPPSAPALGAWARLVAGLGSGTVPAEVGRVLADHPAAPPPPPRAVRPPRELVRRFRSSASPRAVQLAVYLSATPLALPVMRLVQRTMLPDSEPSDLAEVLLSGLLRRSGPAPGQWYEFVPGVQDVLLGPLGRDEAALVLKHCSEYVLAHFGRGVRNFPALAVSQLTGVPATGAVAADAPVTGEPEADGGTGAAEEPGRVPAPRLPQAFAQVSAKVVRRYLPGPPDAPPGDGEPPPGGAAPAPSRAWAVRTARDRLAAFDRDRDGGQRALYEAVAVLRRAVTAPPGPADPPGEAEFELAGALLRLWEVQRDLELLTEAERTARTVSALPGMVRARALLGRALYERAVAALPGSGPEAAELLAAAEREFAAVGAVAGLDRELRLDCAIQRARTLMRLCELHDDPAALREALSALEVFDRPDGEPGAMPDGGPAGESDGGPGAAPDGGLHLALGRVLLALADREPDPAERTALATRSATRLTAGLATLLPPHPDTGPRPPDPGPAAGAPASPVGRDAGAPPGGPAAPPAEATTSSPSSGQTPAASPRPTPGARPTTGPSTAPAREQQPSGSGGGARAGGAGERGWVRVELARALRYVPWRLDEAPGVLAAALADAAGEPELRLAALVCLARVHRARYARDGQDGRAGAPADLDAAADAYGRARRLIPRDGEAYGELLPEWGDVLLERARTPGGRRFVSTAVRVLRDSRAAVPQNDQRAPERLRRLAEGLRLRHSYEGDLVDLREAEYLLELVVRHARGPLEQAHAWREHGDVQQEIHAQTRAADRLDRAADSYRRAWRAAMEADRTADRQETAVQLAARVQELRGEVLERLARPRAALDAYRAALELWQRLGDPAPGTTDRREAVRARVRALEAAL